MNGDVIDEETFVRNAQHEHSNRAPVPLCNCDAMVANDLGIVLGHGAGQDTDALDVVIIRGFDQLGNLRASLAVAGRSE
ncbi:MAG: hypothetical protein M3454_08665 [Actinomycetota bacterium]|nr:hypothetical protein [Actinomycetota bacterium]